MTPDWDAADARRILPRVIDGVVYTGIGAEIRHIREVLAEEWGVYSGHATLHRWLTELCDEVDRLNESLDDASSAAEEELRHRQEQIVEARRISDALAYALMNYFSEIPKPALEAYHARSWRDPKLEANEL